jgi:hypothetical protein
LEFEEEHKNASYTDGQQSQELMPYDWDMIILVVALVFLKLLQYYWSTTWFLAVHPDMLKDVGEDNIAAANCHLDESEFPRIKPLADLLKGTSGVARDLGLLSVSG